MQLNSILTIAIASTALVSACDKKSDSDKETAPKAEPTTPSEAKAVTTVAPIAKEKADVEEVPKEEEPPAALPPETPKQIKAQCAALLQASWKAIQPAMATLEIPDIDSLEKGYTESGMKARTYLEICETLPQIDRKCLTESKNPVAAPPLCGIDSKKTGGKTFRSPAMPGKSPLRPKLAIAKASVARLTGTWLNKSGNGEKTWTIKKGKTKQVQKKSDGSVKPATSLDEFTISFDKEKGAQRAYPGSNSQTLSLFMPNDKTFYANGNLNFGAYDFKDGQTFIARIDSNWLLSKAGKCEVVTWQGQVVPATCAQKEKEGAKYLDVSFQDPSKLHWKTKAQETTSVSFLIEENHLLAEGLVRVGRYDKQ